MTGPARLDRCAIVDGHHSVKSAMQALIQYSEAAQISHND
jgi:hypothetical protein